MDEALSAARVPSPTSSGEGVGNAVSAAQRYLLSIQHPDGHWCGELEGDTILESEYILTLHFLGRTGETRVRKAAEHVRRKQLPSGGWAIYEGGPAEVSASVKAYFALKLTGDDADAPHMAKARKVIRNLGGIEATNSFTRIYLSIFGQWDWEECPAVPPELILLPDWFPFNIYKMSSWSRGIVVPLAVLWAHKPSCPVPQRAGIAELRTGVTPARKGYTKAREVFWGIFFTMVDRFLKAVEDTRLLPWRKKALDACEAWIHERSDPSSPTGARFVLAFPALRP